MNVPYSVTGICPICNLPKNFVSPDDYWSCRSDQQAADCEYSACIPRQRALAEALFSLIPREQVRTMAVHESSPGGYGVSAWLLKNCPGYVRSGYYPNQPFGSLVGLLRNENLEKQTFADETFDVVLHLDVMEHLFNPFVALREIERTLKPYGLCLFTAPTYPERVLSEQVAFDEPGGLRIVGQPEYHGNPQDAAGALVTWRYGYDLPYLIAKQTNFDVELRRWYSRSRAIMGRMTEVYILRKPAS